MGEGALADSVVVQWSDSVGWHAGVSDGTHRVVADGYDLWAEGLDDLSGLQSRLFAVIPYNWQAARVDQSHPEMFSWLGMLDLNVREVAILAPLVVLVFWMGIYPSSFLDLIHPSVANIVDQTSAALEAAASQTQAAAPAAGSH